MSERDWLERDRILSEVHSDMKHMLEWAKSHVKDNEDRFKKIELEQLWNSRIIYGGIGVLTFLQLIGFFK